MNKIKLGWIVNLFLIVAFISSFLLFSCRKLSFYENSNARLEFSVDTLTFDTVFATVGSATKSFKVFNPYNQNLKIEEIRLVGHHTDQFKLNIDGVPVAIAYDVIIPPNDSIYVFAEVTVTDLQDKNLPFVIAEEVQFVVNGNMQSVYLQAWGQSAYFHHGEIITQSTTWLNDKPHVIIRNSDFPGVGIDSSATLTIEAGARIHVHAGSGLFIGSNAALVIDVPLDTNSTVYFEGDRLEPFFDDVPGQWFGIVFLGGSASSIIKNTVINEATYGIMNRFLLNPNVDLSKPAPSVELENVIIKNIYSNAILSANAQIEAKNCLFHNSADHLVALAMGEYQFDNCTFYNAGTVTAEHKLPNLAISNSIEIGSNAFVGDLTNALFANCINYGSLEDEILLNVDDAGDFNCFFDHCLSKVEEQDLEGYQDGMLVNIDPKFEEASEENFQLDKRSQCINYGIDNGLIGLDLAANNRIVADKIDLGCYEAQ